MHVHGIGLNGMGAEEGRMTVILKPLGNPPLLNGKAFGTKP
jgi:hypothetical protein